MLPATRPAGISAHAVFGSLDTYSVFCVPADLEAARAAFHLLRIRATELADHDVEIDAYGITPSHSAGRGTMARVFHVTHGAKMKLYAAGLIDRERIISGGDN